MKLSDILAFAKAGYSAQDVKDLMSLETTPTDPIEPQPVIEPVEPSEPTPNQDPPADPPADPQPIEPVVDYKKLYEESQSQLKKLQEQNIKKNVEPNAPSEDEILADFVRSFY